MKRNIILAALVLGIVSQASAVKFAEGDWTFNAKMSVQVDFDDLDGIVNLPRPLQLLMNAGTNMVNMPVQVENINIQSLDDNHFSFDLNWDKKFGSDKEMAKFKLHVPIEGTFVKKKATLLTTDDFNASLIFNKTNILKAMLKTMSVNVVMNILPAGLSSLFDAKTVYTLQGSKGETFSTKGKFTVGTGEKLKVGGHVPLLKIAFSDWSLKHSSIIKAEADIAAKAVGRSEDSED